MLDHFLDKLDFWAALGLVFQAAFAARFAVQWIASEWQKRSVVPPAFWYLSIFGSTGLLAYAIARGDLVFTLGLAFNNIIYVRNLVLIYRERRARSATCHGIDT